MVDKMTERELSALVDREFINAMGSSGSEISAERAKAWNYYLSKPFGDEIEGQSEIVTSDVSDVVDGMMPSLLRIFSIADNLVTFEPVGEEDVEQAKQESDYVNYVFFKKNEAFPILYTWFFDALLQKNGIVKAWWDDSDVVTRESYRGLTEEELTQLLDDDELEPIERDERTIIVNGIDAFGNPAEVEQKVFDIKFERTSKTGRVQVMNVPPEEYRISGDARSLNPSDARFVGHEREVTRSELIEMGFDKSVVEDLPSNAQINDTEEEIARHDRTDDEFSNLTSDSSQDLITLQEAYIKVDFDGDGRSELRQVFRAGKEILENDEIDRQPFHVISPKPLPHKHFGRATAEEVMDVQKINSTLVRQTHDNLYHTNNPSHAVWEQAMTDNTLDDLLTTRAGSVKRFGRPVNESYSTIALPFTAKESFAMLDFWDRVKRERTGISSDIEGLDPESLKNIQSHVLSQASELSRMKIEAVVRIFAETGIKSLFLHIHELLMKHQQKEEIAELRGQFVPVNPQEWRTRKNMTVQIGLGVGTKEQNLIQLDDLWNRQISALQAGAMDVVTPMNLYNTGSELAKNANLKGRGEFFTEPDPQARFGQNQEQQQQQQQLLELQVRAKEQELQLQQRNQDIEREENQLKHQREIQEAERRHARELEELAIKREKVENDIFAKMEEVSNKLTELELKHNQDVPGSRV